MIIDVLSQLAEIFKVSKGELRRNIEQGGLWVYENEWSKVELGDRFILPTIFRLGKRKFVRLYE